MILLDSMALITPDPGLFFWTALIFVLLWVILGKFAFKPISNALKDRENSIADALDAAEKAKAEMARLTAENDKIIAEAREERSRIIKEAKELASKEINAAKDKAKVEAAKIIENAKAEINSQKRTAIADIKNQVGALAISIAENIVKKELAGDDAQLSLIEKEINSANLN